MNFTGNRMSIPSSQSVVKSIDEDEWSASEWSLAGARVRSTISRLVRVATSGHVVFQWSHEQKSDLFTKNWREMLARTPFPWVAPIHLLITLFKVKTSDISNASKDTESLP